MDDPIKQIQQQESDDQFGVAKIPAHTHNGTDSLQVDISSIARFSSSPAQGDVVYFDGNSWASLGAGTSGQFLKTLGTGANPAWGNAGAGGGTGADGALSITSGTTTLNMAGAAVFVKNYSSISITGTGALAFSNPNAAGTVVVLKCLGNFTVTSTANPVISVQGLGVAGGASVQNPAFVGGTAGNAGTPGSSVFVVSGPGAGGGTGAGGATGTLTATYNPGLLTSGANIKYTSLLVIGAGGGSGDASRGSTSSPSATSGAGGSSAGALYIEIGGAINFTSAHGINANGTNGGDATGFGSGQTGGGGGGGAGGSVIIVYNSLIANSGVVTVAGGTGGKTYTDEGVNGYGGGGGTSYQLGNAGTGALNGLKSGGDGASGFYFAVANS